MSAFARPPLSRASLASSRTSVVSPSASSTGATYRAVPQPSYSSPWGRRPAGSPPPVIPDGQEYYWTDEWQSGKLKSLAEFSAGRGRTFRSSAAALRFLFETESD